MSTRRPLATSLVPALLVLTACAGTPEAEPQPAAESVEEAPAVPLVDAAALARRAEAEREFGRRDAVQTARAQLASGRTRAAIETIDEGEAKFGQDAGTRLASAAAYFELAVEAFGRGADSFEVRAHLADARLRLREATELDADVAGAVLLEARLLRYEEDPASARALLEEHVAAHPDDVPARLELIDMARTARDWELLRDQAAAIVERDPSHGRAALDHAIALQWLGATAEELEPRYLAAARLLPEEDDPLRLLANLYPGQVEERLRVLDQVITETPAAVWARVWKAHVLRQEADDAEAALAVLDEAVELAPEHPRVHANRAYALLDLSRPHEAIDALLTALSFGKPDELPRPSAALDQLVNRTPVELSLERRIEVYDALVAANPSEGAYGNNAGLWFRDVGRDYEQSLHYYQQAVAASPDDQDYLNDTALIYLFHLPDRREQAIPMFERVLELVEVEGWEPMRGYWDALENLSRWHLARGEFERALELSERRLEHTAYPSMVAPQVRAQALEGLNASEATDTETQNDAE